MPLEVRFKRDGTIIKTWYGRFEVSGKRLCKNLEVPIRGRPPSPFSLRDEGDVAYERSRERARGRLEQLIHEERELRLPEKLVQTYHKIRTGEKIRKIELTKLPAEWKNRRRNSNVSPRYAKQCTAILERFVEFVGKAQPNAKEFLEVSSKTAEAFMDAEEQRGVSPKTWNDILKVLRTTFRHLHPQLTDGSNPFGSVPTKETETIHRRPFNQEELAAILEAADGDAFVRPIIITGICTAMRRGDCCLLRWESVDFDAGFVTVKTSKTGEEADIPMFPPLRKELMAARTAAPDSEYCFPEVARMYQENPDGITWRVTKVLARAFRRLEGYDDEQADPSSSAIRERVEKYVKSLGASPKAGRMRDVFESYAAERNINKVVTSTGFSKGTVSNYLNELEDATGSSIIGGKVRKAKKDIVQQSREDGLRRASIRDFHSFRVTWVTVALAAGVPMELVQRVTGHRTVEIVLKHYFRPGREDFRKALESAMPKLLMNGAKSRDEQLREIIERMNPKKLRDEALAILGQG